jgi:hypothetical protein
MDFEKWFFGRRLLILEGIDESKVKRKSGNWKCLHKSAARF